MDLDVPSDPQIELGGLVGPMNPGAPRWTTIPCAPELLDSLMRLWDTMTKGATRCATSGGHKVDLNHTKYRRRKDKTIPV